MTTDRHRISILIADANAMIGELLVAALKRQNRFHVLPRITHAAKLLELITLTPVDVALVGASLAEGTMSGLDALGQVRECCPRVKSIFLLENSEPDLVLRAFRAGAKGIFCPSQSTFRVLCRCVEQVHRGQIWASSRELTYVMDSFSRQAPLFVMNSQGARLLTERETAVAALVAEGFQNREIAQKLNLSGHTVKNYLFRIYDKLGVSTRVELALYMTHCTAPRLQ